MGLPWSPSDLDEQGEAALASFELPIELPVDEDARRALAISVASRTSIAAARGGQLRYLRSHNGFQPPFAVRALLPYWVNLEDQRTLKGHGIEMQAIEDWERAAMSLRPLLSHVSRWLGFPIPRHSRLLTGKEVQSMHAYFQGSNWPNLTAPLWKNNPQNRAEEHRLRNDYLRWLSRDSQLAQQVADA